MRKLLEIETGRGLTEQEVVAKHVCVRKFFEMADKDRGREISDIER